MSDKKEPFFKVVSSFGSGNNSEETEKEPETQEAPVEKKIEFNDNISNDEINRVLEEGAAKNKKGKNLMIIGIILFVISMLMTSFIKVVFMFGGIIIACIGFAMKHTAKNDVKMEAGIHIIHQAMGEVFESFEYQPEKGLEVEDVANIEMGFPFDFNQLDSDDLIVGTYKGMKIRMADTTLNLVTTSTDEDGNERKNTEKVFEGLWMICDFGKELTTDLTITEGIHTKKNRVKTDNEKFNKKFGIYSLNPHEAFYILTPHVMEYILEMDKKSYGDTYMNFSHEGKLSIAINTGHTAFEIDSFKMSADEMRNKFVSEVRYITGLLDELSHVDTMYKD